MKTNMDQDTDRPGAPRRGAAVKQTATRVQQGAAAPAPLAVRVLRRVVRAIFRLVFRVRVAGLEHVPATPVIICANHLGWADMFLVLLFFPVEPRIYILGEQEVRTISAWRTRLIDRLEIMVALDRRNPLRAIRTMDDVLKRGGSLLIFPEGELGSAEGALLPLHEGAAHAGLVTGAPLLPVGLTGTRELWLRRTLTMRIGPPIASTSVTGTSHERVDALTTKLRAAMLALLPGDRARPRWKLLRAWLTKLF
jgi:1-acyl-sn-glycerol-3-phosphate acyltransferase